MEITLLYFDGCPNWKLAERRLADLVAERPDIRMVKRRVDTPGDADRLGFHGSPSVLIDGADAFPDPHAVVGLACRVYATPDGPAGVPTTAQLREVLTRGGAAPDAASVPGATRDADGGRGR